jgi:hypothetical protein
MEVLNSNCTISGKKNTFLLFTDELAFAAQDNLNKSGQMNAAKLVMNAIITPTHATKFLTTHEKFSISHINEKKNTNQEHVGLIMDAKLSKHQYSLLRLPTKSRNTDLYLTYNTV